MQPGGRDAGSRHGRSRRVRRQHGRTAEAFVTDLVAGRFDTAVAGFDQTMTEVMSSAALADTWAQLLGQAGDFVAVQGTRAAREGGYDIVYVTTEFTQMPLDIKVVFDDAGLIAGLFFLPAADTSASAPESAPPYADPAAFTEQEVIVGEGTEWALPGTLTLPVGEGPFPAVVLVHGSGPNDRDETIGPNKPFRDLAWGLAGQGIATLRYEKRTREYQQTVAREMDFTVQEETIDDALAAVALLQGTPAIDPQGIYVLGHSLGGTLIPRIGAQTEDVAGLIVLAGSDRPLEEVMLEQFTYIFGLDGAISAEEQTQLDTVAQQITAVQDPALAPDTPPNELLGAPGAYWLSLRDYVPSGSRANLAPAAADPARRTGLPGDNGRFRALAGGAGGSGRCDLQELSGAEPSVHDRRGPKHAGRV